MRLARISRRTVESMTAPVTGEARLWDTEVKGFCVRAYASGRKVYGLKYRTAQGSQRWLTLGVHGSSMTPDEARAAAKKALAGVVGGHDPSAKKAEARRALTVAQLIDRYLADGPATKPDKRASTWKTDASNLNRHVRPLLGRRLVDELAPSDCARFVTEVASGKTRADFKTGQRGRAIVRGGSGTAGRALGTMASMFAWGVSQGLTKANPAVGVKLERRASRERFLSPKELAKLSDSIDAAEASRTIPSSHADIFRLLILTGARRSEISGLRWSEVDLDRRQLVLPPERTKSGGKTGTRRILLNAASADILMKRKATGEFVFPSADPDRPVTALQKSWVKVRRQASLEGLRIHDLRHSFASLALGQGASLALIGKALGHSSPRVTERYAHLTDDPLRDLVDGVEAALARSEGRGG